MFHDPLVPFAERRIIIMEKEIMKILAAMSLLDEGEIMENDMLTDIGIDSLKIVEVIMEIEDHFNIKFNDSDLDPEALDTVKSVIDLVKKYD